MNKTLILLTLILSTFSFSCKKADSKDRIMQGDKFEIICKHPLGHIEKYIWEAESDYDFPYNSRSGIWRFIGIRVSDNKTLDIASTFCHMERELD